MMKMPLSSAIIKQTQKKACFSMSLTTTPRSAVEKQEPLTRMNPRMVLLALGMFALGTDAFIVAGVLPVIAHETGVTEGLVGQLITVFSLTYGLGAPVLAATIGPGPLPRSPVERRRLCHVSLHCLAFTTTDTHLRCECPA